MPTPAPMQRRPHDCIATTLRSECPDDDGTPVLMLDARGVVQDCSEAGESLFGYGRGELVSRHVSVVLPQLAGMDLIENGCLNAHLLFHSRIGGYFHIRNRRGEDVAVDLFVNDLGRRGVHRVRLIVRPDERRTSSAHQSDPRRDRR